MMRHLKGQLRDLERGLNAASERKKSVQEQETKELHDLAKRIGDSATTENDAVKQVIDETQKVVAQQQQERTDTVRKEQEALTAALRRIQDAHVDQALRAFNLQDASISGIGDALKRKLAVAGVRTAADLRDWRAAYVSSGYRSYTKEVAQLNIGGSWRRVDGIGPMKAAELLAWRNGAASAARASAPKQLTVGQRDQIAQQYQVQRTRIDRQIALAQQQQQPKIAAIRQRAHRDRQALELQVGAVKSKYAAQYGTMNTEIEQQRRQVTAATWRVGGAERALAQYRGITARRYALAILGKR